MTSCKLKRKRKSELRRYEITAFLGDAPVIVQCGAHTAITLLKEWPEAECHDMLTNVKISSCELPALV